MLKGIRLGRYTYDKFDKKDAFDDGNIEYKRMENEAGKIIKWLNCKVPSAYKLLLLLKDKIMIAYREIFVKRFTKKRRYDMILIKL